MPIEATTSGRYPKWSELEPFFEVQRQATFEIEGSPKAQLIVDGERGALSFLVEHAGDGDAEPLAAITYSETRVNNTRFLVLTTLRGDYARNLFDLGIEVADAVQLDGVSVSEALSAATAKWRHFLRGPDHLSAEVETGLAGELWLLRRLIASGVYEAPTKCWAGPARGDHDFLLSGIHVEVKSTRGNQRKHLIDRVDQLEPSVGHPLYLLSIHLQFGGTSGESLKDLIHSIQAMLEPSVRAQFDEILLDEYRLDDSAIDRHDEKFEMRSPPHLILVDETFPRLTRADLEAIPAWETGRLHEVSFVVDVSGMGAAEDSDEFRMVVPGQ